MNCRFLSQLLLLCTLAFIPGACSDEPGPERDATLYDIVAYRGADDAGRPLFTMTLPRSADIITYTSTTKTIRPGATNPGDRILIGYRMQGHSPYTDGDIDLVTARIINNATLLTEWPDDIERCEPVYLESAWLSECYLNLNVKLPYDEQPRLMALVLDTDSPDPARPDLWLIHRREQQEPSFDRRYYISYDLTPMLGDTEVTGFTLHLDNSNLPSSTIDFEIYE